ncbi:unnamed protein product [Euphydryas editha]|uniref:THAP-type domain-containing protein n=1 Tax=Euphydryas editha TaxID=104508 RepID=A0AAU9TVM8_EUPED|nr:unnamed protein product [Euphydryas editha]
MTKTCVVCKKEPISGDKTRSFHKFPANNELKEKWMEALGIQEIKKISTVCSDHFEDDSYHQTNGYTKIRRLLSTAVPVLNRNNSVLKQITDYIVIPSSIEETDHKTCSIVKDEYSLHNSLDSASNTSSCNNECDVSQDLVPGIACDTDPSFPQPKDTETIISDHNYSMNSKGKQSNTDKSTIPKKKFYFMDGYQHSHISRQDFVSDEAWGRFIKFIRYKNRQIAVAKKRISRREKKISNFKDLVKSLQNKNISAAAEYLEDLPEHLKELIARMKDKKRTSPFSSHLKNFARSLHFHSPAAYEMVRQSFLKCLPSIETLNSWKSSKNDKPEICEEIISHISEMVQNESQSGQTYHT